MLQAAPRPLSRLYSAEYPRNALDRSRGDTAHVCDRRAAVGSLQQSARPMVENSTQQWT